MNFLKKTFIFLTKPFLFFKPKNLKRVGESFLRESWRIITFLILLFAFLFSKAFAFLDRQKQIPENCKKPFRPFLKKAYNWALTFNKTELESIGRIDLIELSIRNMNYKKSRSIITIGGMAIGIGIIVFLVSIGYGVQQLVISRVARLDEMRHADIATQTGSGVKLNDKSLSDFKNLPSVEKVLPLISVVGRVNFNNSVTDVAVYGVTSDYLTQSAVKPVQGRIFESNETTSQVPQGAEVAGVSVENVSSSTEIAINKKITDIELSINPGEWIRVREEPTISSKVLGYTKRVEGKLMGEEYWGSSYASDTEAGSFGTDSNGKKYGKWVKSKVLLWEETECDAQLDADCIDGKYKVMRDASKKQVQKDGYFAQVNISISSVFGKSADVLGVSTDSDEVVLAETDSSSSLEFIEIASESGLIKPPETKTVKIASVAKREAVVNRAMLQVLGVDESDAVGKTFSSAFVVTGGALDDSEQNIQSEATTYTIVGVVPDDKSPVFYVPFMDLRSLGIVNYSQAKVITDSIQVLSNTRRQIESMGFATTSVADTVAQIDNLFGTARLVLGLLGTVALGVAALGMFNTLTVSLLERTREVGLMKAMGMRSQEIKELFLTESMVMGFFGGIAGLIIGFFVGKGLSIIISAFSILRGGGILDISYLPLSFTLFIIAISVIVGVITGYYPARRATKISALNALRYE